MEVTNWTIGLLGVPSSLRSQRIGRQLRENEVLVENPYSGCTVSRPDVRLIVTRRTYTLELERTVTVWQENPIFTKHPIVPIFLDLGLF
jgi:hypothetical protein